MKCDKKPFENKTEEKTSHLKTKLKKRQIEDFSRYYTLVNIQTLPKIKFKILKLCSHHSRSVTSFRRKIHCNFIFNHFLFKNLFVQTVRFAMRVKPEGTSSPESLNTYRKTLIISHNFDLYFSFFNCK